MSSTSAPLLHWLSAVISYAAGLKTSAVHRISNDFSTKSDSEEIVLRNDIYGNPVKTLWKWIIESSWYGNIARQYPERTFINATEGGIGLGDIPNLPLAAAAGIHLNNSWDISAHTHAAIQRCQKCLNEDKTDAINIAFDQLISSTQRCLKLINTSQEQLEQSSEPLEQQWQRSQFPLQNEMAGEAAFDYMLKSFDVYHTTMARQRFLRLEADRQRLTPTDILTIQRDIHLKRYQHFSLILAQQVVLLTHTKNEHKALVAKNIEPINEYDLSRDSKEVYSYVDNQVTIIDSSLQLELIDTAQQQLTEKQIPDNESKAFCTSYYNLEGQLHGPSTTYNKDGQLLTITWYFAGQKQGWSRYYWNDGALYCQLPYRNNALHGNASYLYNNGSLRSRIPYKEGQLHGTVELYYPNGQLHRRSEYSHGKRHGSEQVWQADGTLILDAHYLEDKPIGTASQWHFDGTLIRRTSYNASSEILNEEAWNAAGESVSAHFNHDESYLQKMYAQVQDLDSSLETVAKSFDTLGSYLIHYPSLYTIYQQDCKTLYDHKNTVKQLLILLDTSKQPHTQDTGEPLWRSPSFMRTVEKQRDDLIQALQQYLNKLHVWTTTLQAQGLE
jgi:antitoxin component YwqK of YwqJK toxin-antitoxin module